MVMLRAQLLLTIVTAAAVSATTCTSTTYQGLDSRNGTTGAAGEACTILDVLLPGRVAFPGVQN